MASITRTWTAVGGAAVGALLAAGPAWAAGAWTAPQPTTESAAAPARPAAPAEPDAECAPATPVEAPADATPVGLPDGLRLAPYRGSGHVDLSGKTLENVVISSDLTVTGTDVTLRNVRVDGHLTFRRASDVRLESSHVGALTLSGSRGVEVDGVEISGARGKDGVHITSDTGRTADVALRDVWIHSPALTGRSHYDGIQVRGVEGLHLERVRIELGDWARQHNAALFLENANGGNSDVTVVDSWLAGGGYTFYSFASEVAVEGTVFAGGRWGSLYPRSQVRGIVTFEGNTDADGNPVTLTGTSID